MGTKHTVPTGTMSSDSSARERILAAAVHLFMERGFADTTTLEIATRARVSKRELYALVGNKEAMLAACIAERGNRMRLPEGYPKPTNRATLRAALRQYAATMLREIVDPDVMEVLRLGIAEARRSPGIARSIAAMGRGPARAALEALLRPAKESGLLKAGDLDEMLGQFHGLLWGDRLVWILLGLEKGPSPREIDRRAEQVTSMFLAIHGR